MISIKVVAHSQVKYGVSVLNGDQEMFTFLYSPENEQKFMKSDSVYHNLLELLQDFFKDSKYTEEEAKIFSKDIIRNFYEYFSFSD